MQLSEKNREESLFSLACIASIGFLSNLDLGNVCRLSLLLLPSVLETL